MANVPLHARTDAILRRLVRRDAVAQVRKVLAKTRNEDIAAVFDHLTTAETQRLFGLIEDKNDQAAVLATAGEGSRVDIVESLQPAEVADLLERMEPDDATDVIEELPDEVRARVLTELRGEETEEVSVLLSWPSDSAGGIMSTNVFVLTKTATCGQAIAVLQEQSDELDSPFYLYIIDDQRKLVGVVSLRSLLVHPPSTPLVSIMTSDVIAVGPRQDQEEVARYVARYDLLAVPVVDEDGRILGIVTVDDVVDVIREEAAEDMLRLAGVTDDISESTRGTFELFYHRVGWLLATVGGGIVAAELIATYEDALTKIAVLAGFIPVIMGMGGNVGIQSATITVRSLATGHVQLGGVVSYLFREVRVGLLLGVFYGLVLGGYAVLRNLQQPLIGVSIGLSVTASIVLASLFGAGTPVVLSRLGVDPAVSTGPFVTTVVDVLAILIYFNVAKALLPI